MSVVGDLGKRFGDYLSPAKADAWEALRSTLGAGDTVCGEVIDRRPFGVFVDVGAGFPALLEVIQFEDAPHRRYQFEDYPAIGAAITARVVAFNDTNRQIGLTQLRPHPYLDPSP